jgi:hypothetical protein
MKILSWNADLIQLNVASYLSVVVGILSSTTRFLEPPLWSSGKSSRLRFPALPDFLSSSGSGTGSTQPREDN